MPIARKCRYVPSTGRAASRRTSTIAGPALNRQKANGQRGTIALEPTGRIYRNASGRESDLAPALVSEVLHSPGEPLAQDIRKSMESSYGFHFDRVRVHTGPQAVESARSLGARAYTVDKNIVWGESRYSPVHPHGRHLLAHELAHVIQQERGGNDQDAESKAEAAAGAAACGRSVNQKGLGGTPMGLFAQDEEDREPPPPPSISPWTLRLGWGVLPRFGLFPPLTAPTLSRPWQRPPSLLPDLPPLSLPLPMRPSFALPPVLPSAESTEAASDPPSRLPVYTRGRFSLGLRLGFPEAEARDLPGAPPSALAESLRRAEFMNQMFTGQIPQGWEALDKALLARAIWGIFSTHLAPDVARSITRGLSTPTGPGGLSYQLDLVLLTDFSGAGLSFTLSH